MLWLTRRDGKADARAHPYLIQPRNHGMSDRETAVTSAGAIVAEMPDAEQPEERFRHRLAESGALGEDALARAARAAGAEGGRLDRVITRLGLLSEEAVARIWADVLGRPFQEDDGLATLRLDADSLRTDYLRSRTVLPVLDEAEGVTLLEGDPLDDEAAAAVGFVLGRPIRRALATPGAILAALERLENADRAPDADPSAQAELDIARLRDRSSDAPVVQWVEALIDQAVAAGASDIHIDPAGDGLRVRLRVDGALRPADPPPLAIAAAVVSRIKIVAGLDIAERRLPQDGRASATLRGREIDLRIATAPAAGGETVVIRVLDARAGIATLDGLGFSAGVLTRLRRLFAAPRGIVLVTGQTGSGKTTTLYAALGALADERRKLMTIEDPVEYALPGITQIQANGAIGLGFARVLRAILRHNPDLVMVGEIRDAETASTAIEAALTGHPVLSTLHTNSASGAVTRLIEMGVAPYLVAAALSGVVAQRLVPRICPDCGPPPSLGAEPNHGRPDCRTCRGEGVRGRVAVAEVLRMTPEMRAAILAGQPETEIAAIAARDGMISLCADAEAKVDAGVVRRADALATIGGD